ncbi:MAG: ABC transporter permease [Bacteroidota bacterium]|nr:ABC transporter permease [Bacteroidota bacterium]MDP4235038.1 ABC transporter permease [Bacteroidota bacterium]
MKFSRAYAIVLRYAYLLRGSATRIVPLFAWSVIDIVLWGFITKYLNRVATSEIDFVPMLLGAVLFWDFFTRVMQGVTTTFFEDVWSRNFLNIFSTPMKISEYLTGLVATTTITSTVGLAAMLIMASAAFGLSFFSYGLMFIPFVLVLVLFGIAFGIFACALVLRLGPASEWFIWPIPAILAPFAGVFYPVSTLPEWMQYISRILPASYVFEGMRDVVSHRTVALTPVLIGGGIAILYILLAYWTFSRVYRYAVENGLIARYSAESVG